jgi:hypothetical protein
MIFEPRYVVYSASIIAAIVLLVVGIIAVRYLAARGSRWGGRREPRVSSASAKVIAITPIPLDTGPEGARRPVNASAATSNQARASARPARASPKLIPIGGGRPVELPLEEVPEGVVIGREPGCTVVLDDPTISRRHCRLDLDATGQLRVRDLNSGNGTRINGRQVSSGKAKAGDRIGLGSLEFRFELDAGAAEVAEVRLAASGS